jgi:uncharacterized protein (TIGR00251 family)
LTEREALIEVVEKNGAVTFKVRAQPRASKTAVVGDYAGAVKLRIAAPPVDNKANEECRKFFAKLLHVPIQDVEIVAGDSSRDKVIRIRNVTGDRVRALLEAGS